MNDKPIPPQRGQRFIPVIPGQWKLQLATRYLELASLGKLEALGHLLSEQPDLLNKRGSFNRTLLWEAARAGKMETVRWLVEQGAELDATGSYNHESLVQITPYVAAVYYRRPEVAATLLSRGARLDIFRAAFIGDQARVAHLLAVQPDLINAEDPYDRIYYMPLLSFAVKGGNLALVEFLLEQGAQVGPYSAQVLSIAAGESRMDLIEALAAHGADARAVDAGIFVVASDLEIIGYFLDHGVSLVLPGKGGFPPLVYVARGDKGQHAEKVQILLEHGAPVNGVSKIGRTALHYAAAAGHTQVIAVLLDHGADPALKDNQGSTPLDLARAGGKTAAVEALIPG